MEISNETLIVNKIFYGHKILYSGSTLLYPTPVWTAGVPFDIPILGPKHRTPHLTKG